MKKISIKKTAGKNNEFTIEGNIVEGIGELVQETFAKASGDIHLDFSDVTITNSLGIREWIETTSRMAKKSRLLMYKCPPAIVHTINMIPAFITNCEVKSAMAAFHCLNCEASRTVEIMIERDIDRKNLELKSYPTCDVCHHPNMHLEVDADEYFEFLEAM